MIELYYLPLTLAWPIVLCCVGPLYRSSARLFWSQSTLHCACVCVIWTNSICLFLSLSLFPTQLDDCTLQLYKYDSKNNESDYGSYIDLEMTIDEQNEEFEGFSSR